VNEVFLWISEYLWKCTCYFVLFSSSQHPSTGFLGGAVDYLRKQYVLRVLGYLLYITALEIIVRLCQLQSLGARGVLVNHIIESKELKLRF
jgi:hypothetical protein